MINSDGGMILGVFMVLVIRISKMGPTAGESVESYIVKRSRRHKDTERNTNLRKIS